MFDLTKRKSAREGASLFKNDILCTDNYKENSSGL